MESADDLRFELPRLLGWSAPNLDVHIRNLGGGLVADSVLLVSSRSPSCDSGGIRRSSLVVKQLDAETAREACIYETLHTTAMQRFIPELLAVDVVEGRGPRLLLEAVESSSSWPWHDIEYAGRVLDVLAILHGLPPGALQDQVSDWDYESELQARAEHTLERLRHFATRHPPRALGAGIRATRRLVQNIGQLRRALLDGPLAAVAIHGDVHPGNVAIRRQDSWPALFDWARARIGSPLEDVSSWLQWLGFWEPAAKQKHDTLLGRYLARRGLRRTPTSELRAAYWLASASNCLAGALAYHLQRTVDEPAGKARGAVDDCLRVIIRADAYWREGYLSHSSGTSNASKIGV